VRPTDAGCDHPDYRFTLANERTLLAWLRTGLALAAGGIAVATYAPDLGTRWGSAVVALALVVAGLGASATGYQRWRGNESAIQAGRPLPGGREIPAVAGATAVIVLVIAVLVGMEVLNR
jgi:putative membrane protein